MSALCWIMLREKAMHACSLSHTQYSFRKHFPSILLTVSSCYCSNPNPKSSKMAFKVTTITGNAPVTSLSCSHSVDRPGVDWVWGTPPSTSQEYLFHYYSNSLHPMENMTSLPRCELHSPPFLIIRGDERYGKKNISESSRETLVFSHASFFLSCNLFCVC